MCMWYLLGTLATIDRGIQVRPIALRIRLRFIRLRLEWIHGLLEDSRMPLKQTQLPQERRLGLVVGSALLQLLRPLLDSQAVSQRLLLRQHPDLRTPRHLPVVLVVSRLRRGLVHLLPVPLVGLERGNLWLFIEMAGYTAGHICYPHRGLDPIRYPSVVSSGWPSFGCLYFGLLLVAVPH